MDADIKQTLYEYLDLIFKAVDKNSTYTIEREGDQFRIKVNLKQAELMIGENGYVLNSIQHMLRVIIHNLYPKDRSHFLLDINDYRRNREKAILDVVPKIAKNQVLIKGKTLIITDLGSYERMKLHNYFAETKGLKTSSFGMGKQRRLLIMPTTETGSQKQDDAVVITSKQIVQNYVGEIAL